MSVSITLGAAIGAFVIGGILASAVFWLAVRRHRNQRPFYRPDNSPSNNKPAGREASRSTETTRARPFSALNNLADGRITKRRDNYGFLGSHDFTNTAHQRTLDNHAPPPEPSIPLQNTLHSTVSSRVSLSSLPVSPSVNAPINSPSNPPVPGAMPVHEVFVVHHDAGAPPPVTVYTLPGSRVTELPPGYNFGSRRPESQDGDSPPQSQLPLVGERPSTLSSTTSRRDQKALYTPR